MDTEEYNTIKQNLIEQWTETLLVSFGGMDYWTLNKKWKRIHCKQVAEMIVGDIEYMGKVMAGKEDNNG